MSTNAHTDPTHDHGSQERAPLPDSGADAGLKDPVCKMTVTAQSPHQSEHMGRSFYFCGPQCKAKFDASPMQYMETPGAAPPVVLSAAPAVAGTIYTCPMHPEIRQDHPGNCPKCGMTLEPVMPTLEDDENPELRDFQHRFW